MSCQLLLNTEVTDSEYLKNNCLDYDETFGLRSFGRVCIYRFLR